LTGVNDARSEVLLFLHKNLNQESSKAGKDKQLVSESPVSAEPSDVPDFLIHYRPHFGM
jgi:hypothetical protein